MALTFWKGVKGLLGLGGESSGEPRADEGKYVPYTGDEIDSMSLEDMLGEQTDRFGGKVHIISLGDFRNAVGDKWTRLSPKVTLIAESIIQRNIGTGNLFRSYLGDLFFFVYRTVDNDEGRRRTQLIADELGRRLVGAAFAGAEAARVGIGEADAKDLIAAGGSIDAGAVRAVVKPSRAVPTATEAAPKETPASGRADGPAWTEGKWDGRKDGPDGPTPPSAPTEEKPEAVGEWTSQEHDGPEKPGVRMVKIERTKPPPPAEPLWVPLSKSKSDRELGEIGGEPVTVIFRPTWNALNQAVDVHHCLPSMKENKLSRTGEDVFAIAGGAAGIVRLDGLVVREALRALVNLNQSGSKGTLVVPLHYGSLGRPMWPSLLPLFLDCAEGIRLLGLVIEVVSVPPRASAEEITGRIETVRPYCRGVTIRTDLLTPRPGELLKTMPDGLSVSMTDVPAGSRDEETLSRAMTALKQETGELPVCLWGVQRRQEALLALEAGFTWINGSALMTDLPEPRKPLPVTTELFRKVATPAPPRPKA